MRVAYFTTICLLILALTGCSTARGLPVDETPLSARPADKQAVAPPAEPSSTPTPAMSTVSNVKVAVVDHCRSADRDFTVSVQNLESLEGEVRFWGNEVTVSVSGMPSNVRLSADDIRKRVLVTPELDFDVTVKESPSQFHINLKVDEVDLVSVRLRAEPTIEGAPRLKSDLRVVLRRVDEPRFDITCVEHPEVHYGSPFVVPPGRKHFTMTFTQPMVRDQVTTTLKEHYRAEEITWISDHKVTFTTDLKWLNRIQFVRPAPTDARGVPLDTDSRIVNESVLWVGHDLPTLVVDGPNHTQDATPMTSLTLDAVISPDGRHAIVVEEVPQANYGEAHKATIWLVNLDTHDKSLIAEGVFFYAPIDAWVHWFPDSESVLIVDGYGVTLPRQNHSEWLPKVFRTNGDTRDFPINPGPGKSMRGITTSPDGCVLLGIVERSGTPQPSRPIFHISVRRYSASGVVLSEHPVGQFRPFGREFVNPAVVSSSDGKSAFVYEAYTPSDGATTEERPFDVDLDTGEVRLLDTPRNGLYSPNFSMFVYRHPKTLVNEIRLANGEKIAELGKPLSGFSWSPDSRYLAYRDQGQLLVFDASTKTIAKWLDDPVEMVLGWTPKGIWVLKGPQP